MRAAVSGEGGTLNHHELMEIDVEQQLQHACACSRVLYCACTLSWPRHRSDSDSQLMSRAAAAAYQ